MSQAYRKKINFRGAVFGGVGSRYLEEFRLASQLEYLFISCSQTVLESLNKVASYLFTLHEHLPWVP